MRVRAMIPAQRRDTKETAFSHRTQKPHISQSPNSPVDDILSLQRTIGNRAVQRLIRSDLNSQVPSIQRQCSRAAGRVLFNLYASGIGSGYSYIRQGAGVDFYNRDNKPHTITIVPHGIFTSRSFVINPGSRVITRASRTSVERHGTILDNVPRGRSVHDITVCP